MLQHGDNSKTKQYIKEKTDNSLELLNTQEHIPHRISAALDSLGGDMTSQHYFCKSLATKYWHLSEKA